MDRIVPRTPTTQRNRTRVLTLCAGTATIRIKQSDLLPASPTNLGTQAPATAPFVPAGLVCPAHLLDNHTPHAQNDPVEIWGTRRVRDDIRASHSFTSEICLCSCCDDFHCNIAKSSTVKYTGLLHNDVFYITTSLHSQQTYRRVAEDAQNPSPTQDLVELLASRDHLSENLKGHVLIHSPQLYWDRSFQFYQEIRVSQKLSAEFPLTGHNRKSDIATQVQLLRTA